MGCTGCGHGRESSHTPCPPGHVGGPRSRLSLTATDGDSEPGTEVTTAIAVGSSNAVSATIVVFALVVGTVSVALYGSNDLCKWTHLGDIADMTSVGSASGQVAGVPTPYVRAHVTLTAEVGESAHSIVSIDLHTSSL